MAFHSYPDTLRWDAKSGDYGPNFAGHAMGASTYLVNRPTFDWVSFGGNVMLSSGGVQVVQPRDAARKRIFIPDVSLWVELDAGQISEFSYDPTSKKVVMHIMQDSSGAAAATLTSQQTAQRRSHKMKLVTSGLKQRLNGW
jgi:hypothetical protein